MSGASRLMFRFEMCASVNSVYRRRWTVFPSIRQLEFLERSLPFQALDPFRKVGVMAYDKSGRRDVVMGLRRFSFRRFQPNSPLGDTRFAEDIGDQGGYGVSTRVTHLLAYDGDECSLHIGGHYTYSRMTASTNNPVPILSIAADSRILCR